MSGIIFLLANRRAYMWEAYNQGLALTWDFKYGILRS